MADDRHPLAAPEKSAADKGIDVAVKLMTGLVPLGLGGAIGAVIPTTFGKKLDDFNREVASRINAAEQSLSDLSVFKRAKAGDEDAIDVVASEYVGLVRVFLETHDKAKKEALKSAMCSIAARPVRDEVITARHALFVQCLREFTGLHIRLLQVADDGIRPVQRIVHAIDGPPTAALVKEGGNPHTPKPAAKAWTDLYSKGLTDTDTVDVAMTDEGMGLDRRTELGIQFLEFVASPGDRPNTCTL